MIGYGKMHSYNWKVGGLLVAGIGLLLWISHNIIDFTLIKGLDTEHIGFLFWWITLAGLYIAAFSKEKNDDERVKTIRAKSMLVGFNLAMAVLLSFSIVSFIAVDLTFVASDLIVLPTFCLLFYLLFFHIGLHFDKFWDYNDDDSGIFKMGEKRKSIQFIIYIAVIGLLLALMAYETIMRVK